MRAKGPLWARAVMWALSLLLAAAALSLGPVYLVREAGLSEPSRFLSLSYGWTRESLAFVHLLFLVGMLALAGKPDCKALVGRMTGVSIILGLWEILLAVGTMMLAEKARFAPPQMGVTALGTLLLLGGIGLNVDLIGEKLLSPKTPVTIVFAVAIGVAVVAFALIGVLSVRHYARVDYTRAGRYSLPAATVKLLESLDKNVRITTLFVVSDLAEDTLRREVTDLLDEYARSSRRIEISHIDVRREQKATKELIKRLQGKDVELEYNCVIFECDSTGRVMKIPRYEMLDVRPAATAGAEEKPEKAPPEPVFRFFGETLFHQALSTVSSKKTTKLYFVVGHGEKPRAIGPPSPRIPEDEMEQFAKAFSTQTLDDGLRRLYYQLEMLDLEGLDEKEGIPKDCDVLVISGPWCPFMANVWGMDGSMKPFSEKSAGLVRKYLERGGRAFVMLDPVTKMYEPQVRRLLSLLSDYGVNIDINTAVLDWRRVPQVSPYGGITLKWEPTAECFAEAASDWPVREPGGKTAMELHPIVRSIESGSVFEFMCAPIDIRSAPGLRDVKLLTSSKKGWLRHMSGPDERRQQDDPNDQARRTIAVAVEREKTGDPVMVVLGSSNMFIQYTIHYNESAANDEFAAKVFAWLSGRSEQLAVMPRATEISYGNVTPLAIRTVRFISVLVIPSVFILIGAIIWLGRRK